MAAALDVLADIRRLAALGVERREDRDGLLPHDPLPGLRLPPRKLNTFELKSQSTRLMETRGRSSLGTNRRSKPPRAHREGRASERSREELGTIEPARRVDGD